MASNSSSAPASSTTPTGSAAMADDLSNVQSCDTNQFNFGLQQPALNKTSFGIPQQNFGGFPGNFGLQNCQQTTQPQCPISQVQCDQLLNFLKVHNASSSGFGAPNGIGTQIASQVASVMAPALPTTTSSPFVASASSSSSNFSVLQQNTAFCLTKNHVSTARAQTEIRVCVQPNTISGGYSINGDQSPDQIVILTLTRTLSGLDNSGDKFSR
nr:hypothetical protein CFP56_64493 [Quercus suber]